MADRDIREDEYSTAPEVAQLALLIINTVPAHEHLQPATIVYLFRDEEISRGGKIEWASAQLSDFRGGSMFRWGRFVQWSIAQLSGGMDPDFIILVDRNIWDGLDPSQKLALIDHELCHCIQATDRMGLPKFNQATGEPMWALKAHDIEEFEGVIERHGVWNPELVSFARKLIESLQHGPALVAEGS